MAVVFSKKRTACSAGSTLRTPAPVRHARLLRPVCRPLCMSGNKYRLRLYADFGWVYMFRVCMSVCGCFVQFHDIIMPEMTAAIVFF